LVQAFLKKRWVELDFKAPNLPLSLRLQKVLSNLVLTMRFWNNFNQVRSNPTYVTAK